MKNGIVSKLTATAALTLLVASVSWADIPAPPVNQNLGILDAAFTGLVEDDCRVCHSDTPPPGVPVDTTYLPDRHHLLVGTPVSTADNVAIPNPDADGDGLPDATYDCLNCHSMIWTGTAWELDPDFRDCLICHVGSPHHGTPEATAGNCQACHGSLVDNGLVDADASGQPDVFDWLPDYMASLVTPYPGNAGPTNSLPDNEKPNGGMLNPINGSYEGNCDYCHDADPAGGAIVSNYDTHHATGISNCEWCHDFALPPTDPRTVAPIRTCENCHGIPSVHNIQAKTDGTPADGTITPGAELPGYGHIGAQSDCNGCHGFTAAAFTPGSGPVIPQIDTLSPATIAAGQSATLSITGQALTNLVPNPMGGEAMLLTSDLVLTAADGTETVLTASDVTESTLTADVSGLAAGIYTVRAQKGDKISNPVILPVVPDFAVASADCSNGLVTISGTGFGPYLDLANSGTSVSYTVTSGKGKNKTTSTVEAEVSLWSDTAIEASFAECPATADLNTLYGSAALTFGSTEPPAGSCADYSDADSCSADPACEWVTGKKGDSCKDARSGGGKPPKNK